MIQYQIKQVSGKWGIEVVAKTVLDSGENLFCVSHFENKELIDTEVIEILNEAINIKLKELSK